VSVLACCTDLKHLIDRLLELFAKVHPDFTPIARRLRECFLLPHQGDIKAIKTSLLQGTVQKGAFSTTDCE